MPPEVLETFRGLHDMSCPVKKGIQQVSEEETGEKSPGIGASPKQTKNAIKDQKQKRGHEDPGNRGHQKTLLISGKQMVRPVHDKMKSLDDLIFRDPVEQEPMKQVFSQGPDKKGTHKQDHKINNRDVLDNDGIVN